MTDDNGMDPCECMSSHEWAMRRLLNVIRNSQTVCTDNECFETGTPEQPTSNVLLMTALVMVAFFLYYFNPRNRRLMGDDVKPRNDSNGTPPSPSPDVL